MCAHVASGWLRGNSRVSGFKQKASFCILILYYVIAVASILGWWNVKVLSPKFGDDPNNEMVEDAKLSQEFQQISVDAENGDAKAQYNLGEMYRKGEGVLDNDREAVKWYRKAAEQGLAEAQNALGVMYNRGMGVEQDSKEAVKWYHKAAEQGHAKGQSNLGGMYNAGIGVEKDLVTGYAWSDIAAGNGYQSAINNKSLIIKEMTPDQIAEAEALIKEMTSKNPRLLNEQ